MDALVAAVAVADMSIDEDAADDEMELEDALGGAADDPKASPTARGRAQNLISSVQSSSRHRPRESCAGAPLYDHAL